MKNTVATAQNYYFLTSRCKRSLLQPCGMPSRELHTRTLSARFPFFPPFGFNIYMSLWLRCFPRKPGAAPSERFSRRFCKSLTVRALKQTRRFRWPETPPSAPFLRVFFTESGTFYRQKRHFRPTQSGTLARQECHFRASKVPLFLSKHAKTPCHHHPSPLSHHPEHENGFVKIRESF